MFFKRILCYVLIFSITLNNTVWASNNSSDSDNEYTSLFSTRISREIVVLDPNAFYVNSDNASVNDSVSPSFARTENANQQTQEEKTWFLNFCRQGTTHNLSVNASPVEAGETQSLLKMSGPRAHAMACWVASRVEEQYLSTARPKEIVFAAGFTILSLGAFMAIYNVATWDFLPAPAPDTAAAVSFDKGAIPFSAFLVAPVAFEAFNGALTDVWHYLRTKLTKATAEDRRYQRERLPWSAWFMQNITRGGITVSALVYAWYMGRIFWNVEVDRTKPEDQHPLFATALIIPYMLAGLLKRTEGGFRAASTWARWITNRHHQQEDFAERKQSVKDLDAVIHHLEVTSNRDIQLRLALLEQLETMLNPSWFSWHWFKEILSTLGIPVSAQTLPDTRLSAAEMLQLILSPISLETVVYYQFPVLPEETVPLKSLRSMLHLPKAVDQQLRQVSDKIQEGFEAIHRVIHYGFPVVAISGMTLVMEKSLRSFQETFIGGNDVVSEVLSNGIIWPSAVGLAVVLTMAEGGKVLETLENGTRMYNNNFLLRKMYVVSLLCSCLYLLAETGECWKTAGENAERLQSQIGVDEEKQSFLKYTIFTSMVPMLLFELFSFHELYYKTATVVYAFLSWAKSVVWRIFNSFFKTNVRNNWRDRSRVIDFATGFQKFTKDHNNSFVKDLKKSYTRESSPV